jgi:uncharacterized protein with HEPN domain
MNNAKRLEFYLDILENSINDINSYKNKISKFLPLDCDSYEELSYSFKDTLDAIAFRFNKIQSILGEKVFKLFLEESGFDASNKSFLEMLAELERVEILKRTEWLKLREIRNKVSQEYPDELYEIIDNLNKMIENIETFETIYNKIKSKYETIKK